MKTSDIGRQHPVASPAPPLGQDMQLVAAFADASVGMVQANPSTGRFVRVNSAFCAISGHVQEALVGESFLTPVHPDDRESHIKGLAQLLAGETVVYKAQTRFLRPDGAIRWVDLSVNIIRDQFDRPLHIFAVVQDFTEKRVAEEALQQSKDREFFLLRLSDELRLLADPGEIQFAASRLLGEHLGVNRVIYSDIEKSDCITRTSYLNDAAPLVARMPITAFGEALMENYRRGEVIAVNDVAAEPRLTGPERSFLAHIQVAAFMRIVLVKGYEWVGAFGIHSIRPRVWTKGETELVRDVAERIWASVERAKAEASLRESQELSRSTLQALPAHIAVIDGYGNILAVNQAWTDFAKENSIGHESDISAGANYLDACRRALADSEDAARALAGIESVLRNEQPIFTMEYPCHSPDVERWFLMTVVPLRSPERGGAVISHLDITDRRNAERRLRESEERFSLASEAASFGVHDFDVRNRRMNWSQGLRRLVGMTGEGRIPLSQVYESIHPDDRARVRGEMRDVVRRIGSYETEYRMLRPDGSFFWVFDRGQAFGPVSQVTGKVARMTGTIIDITERKQAEEQVRLLMREVNHRSKNLLAVVLAVANQMARQHDPEDFVQRFSERLKGLAASQDLLVENSWKGVDLASLVVAQLSHFQDLIGSRITLAGPPLRLTPMAAQSIGMALHELATNAGKYGSLSHKHGEVKVTWAIIPGKDDRLFHMRWEERGGPPVTAPTHKGFGHTVMVHMAERSLMGEVRFSYEREGAVWEIRAPVRFALDR